MGVVAPREKSEWKGVVVISNFDSLEAAPFKYTALCSCLVCLGLNTSLNSSIYVSIASTHTYFEHLLRPYSILGPKNGYYEDFVVFLSSFRQIPGYNFKFRHFCFLSHAFKFITANRPTNQHYVVRANGSMDK